MFNEIKSNKLNYFSGLDHQNFAFDAETMVIRPKSRGLLGGLKGRPREKQLVDWAWFWYGIVPGVQLLLL